MKKSTQSKNNLQGVWKKKKLSLNYDASYYEAEYSEEKLEQ